MKSELIESDILMGFKDENFILYLINIIQNIKRWNSLLSLCFVLFRFDFYEKMNF